MLYELPNNISSIEDILKKSRSYNERIELFSLFAEKKINRAIFVIDNVIGKTKLSGKESIEIKHNFIMLKEFRQVFSQWLTKSALSRASQDIKKQTDSLSSFPAICEDFEKKYSSLLS